MWRRKPRRWAAESGANCAARFAELALSAPGESHIHSFGDTGQSTWMAGFHQYWMEAHANVVGSSLEDYCLELKAANTGKFAVRVGETQLAYAFLVPRDRFPLV